MIKNLGKIEEESILTDLEQLERSLEIEIEDEEKNTAAPATQQATPVAVQQQATASVTPLRQSKFTAKARVHSVFFPGQVIGPAAKLGEPQSFMPLGYFEKRQKMKAANDVGAQPQPRKSKFMPDDNMGFTSGFIKKSASALKALGTAPVKFLNDLGFFRYMKDRQFNSALRLEKALAEGYENAEQFLRYHPGALKKKKAVTPPAPPQA